MAERRIPRTTRGDEGAEPQDERASGSQSRDGLRPPRALVNEDAANADLAISAGASIRAQRWPPAIPPKATLPVNPASRALCHTRNKGMIRHGGAGKVKR